MSIYMPLDCDGFATALADYLEGDAPDAVRAAVESHAAECAACRQLLEDLSTIRHDAAALPALVPSRDLWSGIAERIDAQVVPMHRPARDIAPVRRSWARPAVAAAALVLVTAGITHLATRVSMTSTSTIASTTPATAPSATDSARVAIAPTTLPVSADSTPVAATQAEPVDGGRVTAPAPTQRLAGRPARSEGASASPTRLASSAPPTMNESQPVYDREISQLRGIMRSRRAQLDPQTVAVLEQSIAVIDSAIAQSRAALAKDPASRFLAGQLNHSLEKKVELLRTAALLPGRT